MKGKVTKDIFLRVGQGVMRIPRNQENTDRNHDRQTTAGKSTDHAATRLHPSSKIRRS